MNTKKATVEDHIELGIDYMQLQLLKGNLQNPLSIIDGLHGLLKVAKGEEKHSLRKILKMRVKILNESRILLSDLADDYGKTVSRLDSVVTRLDKK